MPEDFGVEEVLGFGLSGQGEHLCLHIEKRGQNTLWVARALAEWAGVRLMDVGYCGLKDRHAQTSQWFSIRVGRAEPDLVSLVIPDCRILASARHAAKLRPGQHAGNRFTIRVRQVEGDPAALDHRLALVSAVGVPNYFGEQRFGHNGSNLQQALALADAHPTVWRQRKHQFAVAAVRAWLFNTVLADRVLAQDWQQAVAGDPGEAPSGPLWGRGRPLAGEPLAGREARLLAPHAGWCHTLEHLGLKQERRALVLPVADARGCWDGCDWILQWQLPPGTYATSVLRELLSLERAS